MKDGLLTKVHKEITIIFVAAIVIVILLICISKFLYISGTEEECINDCEELELDYFKHEAQKGFSSYKNCYCLDNKEVKQIW